MMCRYDGKNCVYSVYFVCVCVCVCALNSEFDFCESSSCFSFRLYSNPVFGIPEFDEAIS